MSKDQEGVIATDHPLTNRQRQTLLALANLIIPPSEDGRMPGAAEVDLAGYLGAHPGPQLDALRTELDALDAAAEAAFGTAFADLESRKRTEFVADYRAREPRALMTAALQTAACYYQDDRVLRGIGMEPRPPFPEGYEVEPGDLSLLDPVRKRGPIYREV